MKILFYIDCMRLGGAQRVMKNLTDHFAEGHDVVLVNDYAPSDGIEEYELSDRVRRICLNEKCRSPDRPGNRERVSLLRKILIAERPDAAVSFLGPPNFRLLTASLGLKHKVIVSVRNDPNKEYGTGMKRMLANAVFCLADGVVFQTPDAASYFSRRIRDRSEVIYNPVAPEFYADSRHGAGTEIIAVGRLHAQKNPMLLLEAFIKVAHEIPAYTLGYYGDGELRQMLAARAEASGMSDRIRFHGRCTDIPKVMRGAGIFVLCSDYEGMPNALMEAMASGLPVIAADCPCGGPRMLIRQKNEGLLIPTGDVDALADAIRTLASDARKREDIGRNAAVRALDFSSDVIMKQWENYICGQ